MAHVELHHYAEPPGAAHLQYLRTADIHVAWPDLLLAAITIGRASWHDVVRFGFTSFFDIVGRVSVLLSNLSVREAHGQARFSRTDKFHASDTSEKMADSYRIGLAFAGLVTTRIYDVRWVMHLDVYVERYGITLSGRSRPDLFGQDVSGHWAVVEAKGRSSPPDDSLRVSAKQQCQRILDINGVPPRTRAGIITWFDRDDLLHSDVVDPTLPSEDALSIKFSVDWFVAHYYARFVHFLSERDSQIIDIAGHSFRVSRVPDSALEIGLLVRIYETFRTDRFRTAPDTLDDVAGTGIIGLHAQVSDALAEFSGVPNPPAGTAAGRDGVLVRISTETLK